MPPTARILFAVNGRADLLRELGPVSTGLSTSSYGQEEDESKGPHHTPG